MDMKLSNLAVLLLLVGLLSGCGSDDNDDVGTIDSCDSWDLDIRFPTEDCGSHSTTADTVEISGTAYGFMRGVDCVSVMPPTVTIAWHNASTAETGFGGHNAICLPNPFAVSGAAPISSWIIYPGIINLQGGENIIEVTGSANGRSETSSITVYRSP